MAYATARLLLVHWHPVVLRGLASCLGHEAEFELVGVASTCEQALDMAAELHPDLLLIGYSTPVMGGIEVTRRLIEADPDMLVMLIGAMDGPFLVPGQTSTITVTLKPGTYTYVCSVKYHAAEGMQGTLTVT